MSTLWHLDEVSDIMGPGSMGAGRPGSEVTAQVLLGHQLLPPSPRVPEMWASGSSSDSGGEDAPGNPGLTLSSVAVMQSIVKEKQELIKTRLEKRKVAAYLSYE